MHEGGPTAVTAYLFLSTTVVFLAILGKLVLKVLCDVMSSHVDMADVSHVKKGKASRYLRAPGTDEGDIIQDGDAGDLGQGCHHILHIHMAQQDA